MEEIEKYEKVKPSDKADLTKGFLVNEYSFVVSPGFMRSFGIRRIGDKKVFAIILNGRIIEGTALLEPDAIRVYNAIAKSHSSWIAEREKADLKGDEA